MSDTKGASHATAKRKGQRAKLPLRVWVLLLLQFHAAGGRFFLVVSKNIAASSASFLQAVLPWSVSS
jgi:hypothetical protein